MGGRIDLFELDEFKRAMERSQLPDDLEPIYVLSLYNETDLLKAMGQFFDDIIFHLGFIGSFKYQNIRVLLCFVACLVASYAQFVLVPAEQRGLTMFCVLGYFIFSNLVWALDIWIMRGTVSTVRHNTLNAEIFIDVVPKYSGKNGSEVTLAVRTVSWGKTVRVAEKTVDVGRYFYSDGELCADNLFKDFKALCIQYASDGAIQTSPPKQSGKKKKTL